MDNYKTGKGILNRDWGDYVTLDAYIKFLSEEKFLYDAAWDNMRRFTVFYNFAVVDYVGAIAYSKGFPDIMIRYQYAYGFVF